MHPPSLKTAVRRIRSLAGPADDPPDADLLARFRATRDDRAFATLVARHGPAVLGVCRRVLADPHAAQDAFQATFLVLARRPASVRRAASLGCWLHGVAFRVATKLKGQLARRPRSVAAVEVAADPRDEVLWRDVRRVLDEEVNRLPDRLRLPVYLCYYEGKTRDEAAEALGWKLTTLRGRLEDGRLRLRTRLALRGVELSAALLAVSAAADGLAVGDALLEATVRAAGGSASEVVRSLANGLALSGTFGKAKLTAGAVLLALGLGSTFLVYRGEAGQVPVPGPDPKAAAPPEKEPPPAKLPKPAEWGDPAGDFRIRLHPAGPFKAGNVPEFIVDARNVGKAERKVARHPETAEVELDGRWYVNLDKTLVEIQVEHFAASSEWPKWLTVRPDKTWGHLRDRPGAAGDPGEATKELVPFRLGPGKHTVRVAYSFGKDERAVSNPIAVEVDPDGWGAPAGGVKARLRLPKSRLEPGEPLAFELDLRNEGVKTWGLAAIPFDCEVWVDDEPFKFLGPLDYKAMRKELKPGGELVPFVSGAADAEWKARRPSPQEQLDKLAGELVPFRLTPGKHTVRVVFPLDGNKARVVSNPIEIEVEAPPLDPAVKALALAADRIWVVPSPTREKPVPEPVAVLKGPPRNNPSVFDLRLLPADDPKAKWVVFLRAEEEGKPTPAVQVLPWAQWSRPHTPELAAAIGQAVRPADWGPEAGGLRLGLRLRQAEMSAGGPVAAEVTIGNVGPHAMTFGQLRYNIYDYWPRTRFEVTDPGGKKWLLEKPEGPIKEADAPARHDLKPGETYTHAVRLDRWTVRPAGAWKEGLKPPANLFATPGEYTITARHSSAAPVTEEAWAVARAANPATLTVRDPASEAAWGEAVNGVRVGIRLARTRFGPDEPLSFVLDLKNEGADFRRVEVGEHRCGFILDGRKLALDGQRYVYDGPPGLATVSRDLPPQAEERGFLTVTPGKGWVRRGPGPVDVPYRRPVGKHILAGTYQVDEKTWVTTRPVEFEAADDYGDPVGGVAVRLRMPKQKFPAGEDLAFDLDLKSTADKEYDVPINPERCELHLDGVTYTHEDRLGARAPDVTLPAGMEYAQFIKFNMGGDWSAVAGGRPGNPGPLPLTPGKHRLRVAYRFADQVRPLSREVEFEVTSEEWGEPADGIRGRLRVRNTRLAPGERLLFDLDLKNDGPGDRKVEAAAGRCVLTLDGRPYHTPLELERPRVTELKAKAGTVWFLTVGPDQGWGWVEVANARRPFKLTPGKHTLSVSYPVGDKTRVATRPVEFEVAGDEWGEPASGVRARVRLTKNQFKTGEPLAFEFDLKNTGTEAHEGEPIPMLCRIDLDGVKYQYTAPLGYPTATLKLPPGKEYVPWVKVETNQWWTTVRDGQAVSLALTPGRHKLRVSYPLRDKIEPTSTVVEFDVADEAKAPDLAALVAAADRIVVADIDFLGGVPRLTPKRTLKGPHNRWQPDVQRIDVPRGADILPGEVPNDPLPGEKRSAGIWVLFLKAEEDGVEMPKLVPAVARGWYREATDREVAAVVAALPKPPEAGPEKNGLTLALRPKSTTIRAGDEVRLEVVLTNAGKDARRVLQQRYNVYDYWPFLTFTITGPDGQQVTLRKPEGLFKREDYVDDVELKAGDGYAHAVRLDRWPNALRGRAAPGAPPREPFLRPGRYTVTVTYKAPGGFKNLRPLLAFGEGPFYVGELTSNPITIEVKAEVGVERQKGFADRPDRLHLTLSRWSDRTPADQFDAVLHLHATPTAGGHPGARADRIVAGEATKLIAALAADGFFDRAYDGEKAHERTGKGFFLELSRGGEPTTRLRLMYPWTEATVRRLMKLAPCLNGSRPDRLKELLAPLADTVPPWGEAVNGLSSRLHVPDPATPTTLELEVRNRGTSTWPYVGHAAWTAVEVDGGWYGYPFKPVDVLTSELKPGAVPQRPRLTLDNSWVRGKTPLELKPGKHTLRAAYVFDPPYTKDGARIRIISQPVEIEVPAPKTPFDLVRLETAPGQVPLLYLVVTAPQADHEALEGLVTKHAAAALAEADRQKFTTGNVVFLVREAVGHDRGYTTGFSREQLEEITKAAPAEARRLVGRHAWTTGKLPAGK